MSELKNNYEKGSIEEVAFFAILNGVSEAPDSWDSIIPNFVSGAKFGYNLAKQESNDRIEVLVEKYIKANTWLSDGINELSLHNANSNIIESQMKLTECFLTDLNNLLQHGK